MISGLSAKAPVQLVRDIDVLLARETRRLPFAVVADLGVVSAAFGRPIDVLLGADMFTGSCFALDFRNMRLAVAKSGDFLAGPDWRAVSSPSMLMFGIVKTSFVFTPSTPPSAAVEMRLPVSSP